MGISAVKWRCPNCNIEVGGSMGELKNHMKKVHRNVTKVGAETTVAAVTATVTTHDLQPEAKATSSSTYAASSS